MTRWRSKSSKGPSRQGSLGLWNGDGESQQIFRDLPRCVANQSNSVGVLLWRVWLWWWWWLLDGDDDEYDDDDGGDGDAANGICAFYVAIIDKIFMTILYGCWWQWHWWWWWLRWWWWWWCRNSDGGGDDQQSRQVRNRWEWQQPPEPTEVPAPEFLEWTLN